MILELLSFLPLFHEESQKGRLRAEESEIVTNSFCSKDNFWEGIMRTKEHLKKEKDNRRAVPFRNDKGRLKTIMISEEDIKFNLDLENAKPKNLEKWVLKYFFKESAEKEYPTNYKTYIVYNHDGELIHGFTFEVGFDIDSGEEVLKMRHETNRDDFYCLEHEQKWKVLMNEKEYHKSVGYNVEI